MRKMSQIRILHLIWRGSEIRHLLRVINLVGVLEKRRGVVLARLQRLIHAQRVICTLATCFVWALGVSAQLIQLPILSHPQRHFDLNIHVIY